MSDEEDDEEEKEQEDGARGGVSSQARQESARNALAHEDEDDVVENLELAASHEHTQHPQVLPSAKTAAHTGNTRPDTPV